MAITNSPDFTLLGMYVNISREWIYKVTNKHLNCPPPVPSTIHAEVLIFWVFGTQLINVKDWKNATYIVVSGHMIWNDKSLLHLFSSLHLIKARIVNYRISCFFCFFLLAPWLAIEKSLYIALSLWSPNLFITLVSQIITIVVNLVLTKYPMTIDLSRHYWHICIKWHINKNTIIVLHFCVGVTRKLLLQTIIITVNLIFIWSPTIVPPIVKLCSITNVENSVFRRWPTIARFFFNHHPSPARR